MGKRKSDSGLVMASLECFERAMLLSRESRPFRVTLRWLLQHTRAGSPNARQFACLGIVWPPRSGWRDDLDGIYVTDKIGRDYEEAGGVAVRRREVAEPKKAGPVIDAATWTFPFGRHQGSRLCETPIPYLIWVSENFREQSVQDAAAAEVVRRFFPEAAFENGLYAQSSETRAEPAPLPENRLPCPRKSRRPVEHRPGNAAEECPFDVSETCRDERFFLIS